MTTPATTLTPKFPEPIDFLINYPLYEVFTFTDSTSAGVNTLYGWYGTFDSYCPHCNKESTFTILRHQSHYLDTSSEYKFTKIANCARADEHTLIFWVHVSRGTIQKIGQTPSLADLNLFDAKQYASVLPPDLFKEFTKAIGLAAHGVGIGSFVYLRRIFESLIEKAHLEASKSPGWDEAEYIAKRMAERIEHLKALLPEFLVETRSLYSILSKGIHELTENECLKAFPAVKVGIELILDEELEKKRRLDKIAAAKKSIASLHQGMSK